jgi:hypothetical protein
MLIQFRAAVSKPHIICRSSETEVVECARVAGILRQIGRVCDLWVEIIAAQKQPIDSDLTLEHTKTPEHGVFFRLTG